jgi:hypothetical protein
VRNPEALALLILVVAGWQTIDLVRTLRTGRARLWVGRTATREHQSGLFWRYVVSAYVVLTLCAGAFVWVVWWPHSLR